MTYLSPSRAAGQGLWRWFFLLLAAHLVVAQTRTISITSTPTALTLPALNVSSPAIIVDVPAAAQFLTFNIVSIGSNASVIPSVIVSTASSPDFAVGSHSLDPKSGGQWTSGNSVNKIGDTWKLQWDLGFANWTGQDDTPVRCLVGLGVSANGTVAGPGQDIGDIVVEIGASSTNPLHSLSPSSLYLGDTTANSVLLLSPLLSAAPRVQPTFPNYTLPPAQLPLGSYAGPSAQTNLTSLSSNLALIIVPTSASPTRDGLDNSIVAVHAANTSTGNVAAAGNMLINGVTQWVSVEQLEGYRTMWVVGNLLAETNYTAWLLDDAGGLSAPMWFYTKESAFPCQLALPTALCPAVAYSVPLPANTSTTTLLGSNNPVPFPLRSYPDQINNVLTASLEALSISLTTIACGRDLYSHVATCADCYASYRDWLCRVSLPQCASASVPSTNLDIPPQTTSRNQSATRADGLQPPYAYTELLPCLSNCNRADKDCPVFLLFRCPDRQNTAAESYAFIGGGSDDADGDPEYGPPPIDRWGWRWCNG